MLSGGCRKAWGGDVSSGLDDRARDVAAACAREAGQWGLSGESMAPLGERGEGEGSGEDGVSK